jgi:hypothetical protein
MPPTRQKLISKYDKLRNTLLRKYKFDLEHHLAEAGTTHAAGQWRRRLMRSYNHEYVQKNSQMNKDFPRLEVTL